MAFPLGSLAAALLVTLWALQQALLLTHAGWLVPVSVTLLSVYVVVGFLRSRPLLRMASAVALVLATGLAWRYGRADAIWSGARAAVLFIAFLVSMQLLKVGIETGAGIEQARAAHEALAPREQHDAMLLRAFLLAAIFAAGTLTVISPMVDPARPEPQRRALGQAALQGVSLALFWSPFFVAMAVCLRLSSRITLPGAIAGGLGLSALGLLVSHFAFGGRLRAEWIRPLWRVLAASVAMAGAILVANTAWGIGNSEAIVLGVPLVALVFARRAIAASPQRVAHRWLASLQAIAPEATLVSTGMMLGEVVNVLLTGGLLSLPFSLDGWPQWLLVAWPSAMMALLTIAGFHPVIGASLLFPLQGSLASLHPLVAAGSVMVGWSLSVIVSTFAVPVLLAANQFGVAPGSLVRGRTLRYIATFLPLAWAYLWLGNQWLGR